MGRALAGITAGDLDQRVDVPNRDEFGQLAHDLNQTSERLGRRSSRSSAPWRRRLEETNASLARASEAKSRFLASVSHELRTPMNAILGFTDALLGGRRRAAQPGTDRSRSAGSSAAGVTCSGLINEILDLSKIEAGRLTLDPQPFDPRELVESVVAQSPVAGRAEGTPLQLAGRAARPARSSSTASGSARSSSTCSATP